MVGSADRIPTEQLRALLLAVTADVNERGAPAVYGDQALVNSFSEMVTDDFECGVVGNPMQGGRYRGTAGFVAMQLEWAEQWAQITYEIGKHAAVGPRLLFEVTYRGFGRHSGVEVEAAAAWLYVFEQQRIRAVWIFMSVDDAYAALSAEQAEPANLTGGGR